MQVPALLDGHQRFSQQTGAEVGHNDRHRGKARRDCSECQRISEPQIERGRQPKLFPHSHGQHAAVHEHGSAVRGGRRKNLLHALIVQSEAVHGRKKANAAQAELAKRARKPGYDVAGRGIEHEEPDETGRVPLDRRRDRFLIAGNARDDCRACDSVPIEFRNPAIGQVFRSPRVLPSEPMRDRSGAACVGQVSQPRAQQLEEPAGKKVAMSVARPHGEKPIIIGLVSDTHGLLRDGLLDALAGASQILHAGDVGGRSVLDALGAIAPVQAVYGNVDPLDGRLPQRLTIEAGGLSIHVSHGDELGRPTPAKLLSSYSADILVYGHTHQALIERHGRRLVVNPGAAGPRRFDLKPSVARLTIDHGHAEIELVWLADV